MTGPCVYAEDISTLTFTIPGPQSNAAQTRGLRRFYRGILQDENREGDKTIFYGLKWVDNDWPIPVYPSLSSGEPWLACPGPATGEMIQHSTFHFMTHIISPNKVRYMSIWRIETWNHSGNFGINKIHSRGGQMNHGEIYWYAENSSQTRDSIQTDGKLMSVTAWRNLLKLSWWCNEIGFILGTWRYLLQYRTLLMLLNDAQSLMDWGPGFPLDLWINFLRQNIWSFVPITSSDTHSWAHED